MVNPVQQSGDVTPGHLTKWVTDGVVADAGIALASQKVLAVLANADFNSTADQILALPSTVQAFQLTAILITNASVSLTTAVGGFYPLTGKAGTAIVANTQVYSALTASSKLLSATLAGAAATTRYSRANLVDWFIYLSLTTPQGSAAAADIYVIGVDLTIT